MADIPVMDDGEFKIVHPPAPQVSDRALAVAHEEGRKAGVLGQLPYVPQVWSLCARAWSEGWREGYEVRNNKLRFCAIEVDYDWKGRG